MCHTGECGCRQQVHHADQGGGHHQGCCDEGFGHRRFLTQEETLAQLEDYLSSLRAEVQGLEEHITELKK